MDVLSRFHFLLLGFVAQIFILILVNIASEVPSALTACAPGTPSPATNP